MDESVSLNKLLCSDWPDGPDCFESYMPITEYKVHPEASYSSAIGFMHSCTTSWTSASSLFSCLPLLGKHD